MLKAKLGACSKIDVPLFEELLAGYDVTEAAYVLPGLKNGFPMGVIDGDPPLPEKSWGPLFLSNEEREIVNIYLDKEIALGRIYGPYVFPPRGAFWAGRVVYPMSVAPKKDGGHRIISNLSAGGKLLSVNGFIPKNERTTSYPSFLEIAQAIVSIGLNDVFFRYLRYPRCIQKSLYSCSGLEILDYQLAEIHWWP